VGAARRRVPIEVVRRSRPVIDELDEEYADNPEGIVVVVATAA
jgi:hypothetical protein